MIRIAVTGGIACGKSTVGRYLSQLGIDVADTDEIVRSLHCPGGEAAAAVASAFGKRFLLPDGATDRALLAELVFKDAQRRRRLEEILHPLVRKTLADWLSAEPLPAARAALIPLLFQTELGLRWDRTVTVECSREIQMRRLLERGYSPEHALARLNSQLTPDERIARADVLIENNGTEADLQRKVLAFLRDAGLTDL